jgi:hypothetical protein
MIKSAFYSVFVALLGSGLFLTACTGDKIQTEAKYPTGYDRNTTGTDIYGEKESIFGDGGLGIFGGRQNDNGTGDNGIAVNSYLWRAALDTVSFMPLASADPFGGTILTDWYSPPETPNERFKINVFILGRQLRSDGVRVRLFKQEAQGGIWKDIEAPPETSRQLEDTILTRARQLRVAYMGDEVE